MSDINMLVSHRKSINYALVKNSVKTIQYIRLSNDTEEDYGDVILRMESSPDFATVKETTVTNFNAGAKIEVSELDVEVNGDYLANITEKVVGNLLFSVVAKVKNEEGNYEDKVIYETTETIEILPYNQWGGMAENPEYLASFVMPNHSDVSNILPLCIKQLEEWKQTPSITGYQTQNKNTVKYQMAAAYEVLRKEGIAYAVGQASFEEIGQRIRTADEIIAQKIGNCLDLTTFMASILEAMGLNPLIMLMKGHAYVGCWLEDLTFPDCIEEDPAAISKRIAAGIDEIMLVECTALAVGSSMSFEEATKAAQAKIEQALDFEMAIDIKRCRGNKILPLPSRVLENGSYKVVEFKVEEKTEMPKELSTAGINAQAVENVMTKQKMWERKLLDLSLRNPLINFRVTKSFVQLASSDIARFEDVLNQGESLSVHPFKGEGTLKPEESKIFNIGEIREYLKASEEDDFKANRVRAFLNERDLEVSMKQLSRQAKLSLEENGSNTLYLALGFLKWYESDISEKERYAPLILVPVDVVKKLQDKAYHIRIRDEESMINITMLEYLRQNFGMDIGGLDPLPVDENGIDIQLILNTIRKSVMSKAHWDVLDYAFVGVFSFSRFIMWNDLKNRSEDILGNKVVKSLLSGQLEWQPVDFDSIEDLDSTVKPSDMAVVCSADASQMKAIQASSMGESFVLHGPPGTGKSQTITNMIANALYQGKSVLFVAEKMAALSVVQNRLEKVGLGAFCLELHSNKAQKSAVLAQLERSLKEADRRHNDKYALKADELYELRNKLNDIVIALHGKTKCDRSVYELIGDYESNAELAGKIQISNEFVDTIDANKYSEIVELLEDYYVVVNEIGDVTEHPLKSYVIENYSQEVRDNWVKELEAFRENLALLKTSLNETLLNIGIESDRKYTRDYITWLEMALKKGMHIKNLPACLDTLEEYENLKNEIYGKIAENKTLDSMKKTIKESYKNEIFAYDIASARNRLVTAQGKWALAKKMEINSLLRELRFMAVNSATIKEDNLSDIYLQIEEYKELEKKCVLDDLMKEIVGDLYREENTDWDQVEVKLDQIEQFVKAISLCPDKEDAEALTGKIVAALNGDKRDNLADYIAKSENVAISESKLMSSYGLKLVAFNDANDYIQTMRDDINIALDNKEEMRSYSSLCSIEKKIEEAGLGEAFEAVRNGSLYASELTDAFKANFGKAAALKAINESEVLKGFNGSSFTAVIERFKAVNDEFEELTRKEVAARLSENIPKISDNIVASSAMGILQKAIKSGVRAMPIRKLFNEIPTLLRKMCPCMLMSPISVAQYIDPSFPKFDLVIFDEASQLPTSESVGVLARGENVIVVGDPKQLPPTSFFMTNHEDEETYEYNDMESLLDDCLAVSMPSKHLLWHYRSRHESLIAYSNLKYYDNKLYTFPSPNDLVSEVKLIQVDGAYERGRQKVNRAEAEAIVAEIMTRLKDEKRRKESIGVVTFSQVQQAYIEDLLQDELHKEPEIEIYAQGMEEPIFVKNLENVQGDERDVIMFSICYGPDETGKVSMNFGPLNQDGGWRRLNVAISRSRKQMLIYSTIRPEQIDIQRTQAEGVIGLKGFLEFAAHGKNALFARNELIKKRNSDVAEAIKARLRKDGYKANLNVGSSEFRLDIGIVDPKDENKYCLGILLDGENYYDSELARDRNILQPSVLKGLGWKLHRVWTLDWFDTEDKEYEKIVAAIEKSMTDEPWEEEKKEANEETITEALIENQVETEEDAHPNRRELEIYSVNILGDNEDFYSRGHDKRIMREIENIMNVEAPIARKALMRKVMAAYEITKMSTKSENRIVELLDGLVKDDLINVNMSAGETFYWLKGQDMEAYDIYRIPADSKNARPINEICKQEIVNAVTEIVYANERIAMEDCIRKTGEFFGVKKLSAALNQSVREAICYGEQKGLYSISDDGEEIIK